ncbi:hypothetical protein COBT_002748 [Conglomerata obtusa]
MYGKYTIDFNFIRMNKILNNSDECGYTCNEKACTTYSSFINMDQSKKEKFEARVVTEKYVYDFYSATYIEGQDCGMGCQKVLENVFSCTGR